MSQYHELMNQIGYEFSDIEWLQRALTHRSYASGVNNERLEFLGDAILSAVISEDLFCRDRDVKEGKLSRMRAALVNGDVLAGLGRDLNLSDYIRLGPGEIHSGGRQRDSIIADAVEAVIGAIYVDGGMDNAAACVRLLYQKLLKDVTSLTVTKDAKSQLQEWAQSRRLGLPKYTHRVEGLAHKQTFHVTCVIEGCDLEATGLGASRRKAEKDAAQHFLDQIHDRKK